MDFSALLVVLALVVFTTLFQLRRSRRSAKLPPGPRPFPIVGNLLQLGENPHESLATLAKTYGPLMSVHLGSMYTVVVSSPEMGRQLLQKHGQVFAGRPIVAATHAHDHYKTSVAFLPVGDEKWRKLRKISQEQMFTAARLEASQGPRQEDLQKLYDFVQKCCDSGKAVNIGQAAFTTTMNLMSATLFSVQVADFASGESQEFKETVEALLNLSGSPNLADFFPILRPIDPQGVRRRAEFFFGKLLALIEDLINKRRELRRSAAQQKEDSPKRSDFMETLIDVLEDGENELNMEVIKHLLLDLFLGGSDTSSSVVEWAMTELLLNPDKLAKAKHELRTVIGEKKQVQESDISRLPYLQAVIKETFRFRPPGAFILPRKSESEVEVNGYTIPKDAQMIVNFWAMGRNPNIWENPDRFEPERFLDSKVEYKGQNFELIPFGAGRRICPGLPLANRMMHLTVATLIHNFDWKLQIGTEPEFHKPKLFGILLRRAVPLMAIPVKSEA